MQCPFKDARCYSCGKTGHIKSVCRNRRQEQQVKQMELHEAAVGHGPGSGTEDSCEEYDLFQLS